MADTEVERKLEEAYAEKSEILFQMETVDAFRRLQGNKDFQKIILEGFLENEAARTVGLLPVMGNADDLAGAYRNLHAYAVLRAYFAKIERAAQALEYQLGEMNDYIVALENE